MKPYLSVIVPSYNEERNIKRGVLDELLSYLKKQKYEWEIILSDDGSADNTLAELKKFAEKDNRIIVVANKHAGKAPTVTSGMLKAKGDWRLFTDFDQSTPISEIEKLFEFTNEGYKVVIGSRELEGAKRDKEPFYRHIMGKGFNFLVQTLAVPGIHDTQCGFKLFSEDATKVLFNKLYVYGNQEEREDAFTGAADVELLFLARKMGYKIKEVPITWKHHYSERVSAFKDSFRMFRDIVLIRISHLLGKYN